MSSQSAVEDVASVLEDPCSRCILVQARDGYTSVPVLAEACDVSEATVYRRLEPMREHDLVLERTVPDEDGHHYTTYRTNLDHVTFELGENGFTIEVSRRDSPADRFTRLIEEM